MIYGELGRIPLNILIKARMAGFWQHIMCGKREKNSYTVKPVLGGHLWDQEKVTLQDR